MYVEMTSFPSRFPFCKVLHSSSKLSLGCVLATQIRWSDDCVILAPIKLWGWGSYHDSGCSWPAWGKWQNTEKRGYRGNVGPVSHPLLI